MKRSLRTTLTTLIGLVAVPALAQGSPWLPVPKTGTVSIIQVSQYSNEFYRGTERRTLPFSRIKQNTTWLSGTYGLADAFALDARFGRSTVEAGGPLGEEKGPTDISAGLTWRFVDEDINESGLPSVAVRVGVIKAGNYDVGMPHAIGDGGDGFEVSVMVGKIIDNQLALAAEFGQRSLGNDIPRQTAFTATAQWLTPVSGLSLRAQYYMQSSSGDLDIGGMGFSPARFPEVAEEVDRVSVGVSYSLGPLNFGVDKFSTTDGRNTADFNAWAASVTYSFDTYKP